MQKKEKKNPVTLFNYRIRYVFVRTVVRSHTDGSPHVSTLRCGFLRTVNPVFIRFCQFFSTTHPICER